MNIFSSHFKLKKCLTYETCWLSWPKFCNIIFFFIKVGSVRPVDQQMNFVLPDVFPLKCFISPSLMMMMMMMMMMMNCFCSKFDPGKASRLVSSRDHCQKSSLLQISDTPRAGFEPGLCSGFGG